MAQYCPKCKWYSADGLTHCSTCGAAFEEEVEDEVEEAEEEVDESSLFERVGWGLAIGVGALVGGLALYGRYGTPERIGAVSAAVRGALNGVKEIARGVYHWLIGPQGEYKDFVVIALAMTAIVWIVLWVLGRFNK